MQGGNLRDEVTHSEGWVPLGHGGSHRALLGSAGREVFPPLSLHPPPPKGHRRKSRYRYFFKIILFSCTGTKT